MAHQKLHLESGLKFSTVTELNEFINNYAVQENQVFSVHKSKTLIAVKTKKINKVNPLLEYYSAHYRCQCSGIFKSKGKGLKKSTSIKTNCPAFIKIKLSHSGLYLEVATFNVDHNHPPMDLLTTNQLEPEFHPETPENAEKQEQSSDEDYIPRIEESVPHVHEEHHPEVADDFDINSLSIYVAQDQNSDENISSIRLDTINLNSTLPIVSSTGIPSHLKIVKVKVSTCGDSIIPEEPLSPPHLDDDLAAVLDATEFLHKVEEEVPPIVSSKELELKIHSDSDSIKRVLECRKPKIYSMCDEGATNITADTSSNVTAINMPPVLRSKGRPKGAKLTAIGLPRRETRAVDFNTRTPKAKAGIILGWLIRTELIPNVLNGEYLIQKKDIQHAEDETLTDAVADDCIDLSVVQSYFEKEAFSVLKRIVTLKRKNKKFTCKICAEVVREPCVLCDCCFLWYHFSCEKLKRAPKAETWFCSECRSKH